MSEQEELIDLERSRL